MLVELAARVRAFQGGRPRWYWEAPCLIGSTPAGGQSVHRRYDGYAFQIFRRYVSRAQALAFQAMLDRLAALNLIAWERTPETIDISRIQCVPRDRRRPKDSDP